MEWSAVIIGAIGGGIGGGLGAYIGTVLPKSMPPATRTAVMALGAVVGMMLGPQLADRFAGASVRDATGDTGRIEEEIATLLEDPAVGPIFERHPDGMDVVRSRLREAYRQGGMTQLTAVSEQIGEEYSVYVLTNRVSGARSQDLVEFARAITEIGDGLLQSDPDTCYSWFYRTAPGVEFDGIAFATQMDDALRIKLMMAIADIDRHAAVTPVSFNQEAAETAAGQIYVRITQGKTPSEVEVISQGRAASTSSERRAGCQAIVSMYEAILREPNAGDIVRLLLSP